MEPSPLRRVFALEALPADSDESEIQLSALDSREAMSRLIANTYTAARRGNELLQGTQGGAHFQRCAQLLRAVPVMRLRRRLDMTLLPQVAHLIETEVRGKEASAV
jgi:hypothetical protein